MGIRDDRYDAQVPTVTAPVKRKKSVHGDAIKFCREHASEVPALEGVGADVGDEAFGGAQRRRATASISISMSSGSRPASIVVRAG